MRQAIVTALRERFERAVQDGDLPAGTDCATLARYTATVLISFTGAIQTLAAFQPRLELGAVQDAKGRLRLCHDLLDAVATHRVGDRPDRYEPRLKKRRRNNYDWLTRPRAEMKRQMAKGVTEN